MRLWGNSPSLTLLVGTQFGANFSQDGCVRSIQILNGHGHGPGNDPADVILEGHQEMEIKSFFGGGHYL